MYVTVESWSGQDPPLPQYQYLLDTPTVSLKLPIQTSKKSKFLWEHG